jgi:hypothetical protein
VSGVDSFIHQIIEQSSRLDRKAITALCKIKVVRLGGRGGGPTRKPKKITPLGNQTWLVGVWGLIKMTNVEEQWIEDTTEVVARKHGTDAHSIESIKWEIKGRFADKAQPGDQLLQIVAMPVGRTLSEPRFAGPVTLTSAT